ncbi:TRF-like 8 [Hibiscus trionum]|uniref:TRF-like 8 n=1 Tax=Hibiscus trionum TaxID=183268 RepID=A0A9W7HP52_HIBTR|nr:TRF-like 8 [Hibiscus trionum]
MRTDGKPLVIKKPTDVKRQRVDGSIVPGLEDEATEVEHLLEEPQSEHISVDGVLCFGKESIEKHLKMEDFSFAFDYGWKVGCGGLDSIHGQGGDDLKLEVLDGLLDEVDEVDDIHATNDFSSTCEDFLLDIEFPEKFSELDYVPREVSNFHNSSSESHSPGISGSNSVGGISESSIVTVQESNYKNGVLGKMANCDLHHTFGSKCSCPDPVMETGRPSIQHDVDFVESDDEKPLVSFILSNKKVKSSVKVTKGGTHLRQKRVRKPTRRYIEEFSRNSTTGKKCLKVGPKEDSPQVPETQPQRGRPRKIVPKLEFERSKTACDRRKHQRMWTLAEVIKLVDGIAQYGVGRWTDIKKLLFASSSYRTPVDLRDKWRNLLRSSSAHKHNMREVEDNTELNVRLLPKTVVCRIRELATIHPYPKVRNSNLSSKQLTTEGAPVNSHGRNLRWKKSN